MNEDFLTEDQAANDLGAPKNTLRYWRSIGKGPRFYKIGKRVYYTKTDNAAYVASCVREPVAKAAGA